MDTLRLLGMHFYGYHGAYQEEKTLGGNYTVDLEIVGDFSGKKIDDDIHNAVDLSDVYKVVERTVCERSFNLIETLAEEIALAALERFPLKSVTVSVRKKRPPIEGIVEAAEAVVTRAK